MLRSLAIVLGPMLFSAPSSAQNIAHLRTDCTGYSNCFTDMTSLSTWLNDTRWPTSADPITVNVGVGDFTGRLYCNGFGMPPGEGGHATYKGESRSGSRLVGTNTSYPFATVHSANCDDLDFQNLTIVAPDAELGIALYWTQGGDSRWIDVDVQAPRYAAWYDSGCAGVPSTSPPAGIHYFQNSTLTAAVLGWYSDCGEALLYKTQISVVPTNATSVSGATVVGVMGNYLAELYLLDSEVTVDATQRSAATTTIGLDVGRTGNGHPQGSGEIEMFGGALTVKGNPDDTLHGARTKKFSETAEPAAVRIQGTQLKIQNGTAAASVVSGDGDLERVDLAP